MYCIMYVCDVKCCQTASDSMFRKIAVIVNYCISLSLSYVASHLGLESYDRDLRYRCGLLNMAISQHRIGATISLRRDNMTWSYIHHLAAPVHSPVISDKITGHVNTRFACQVNALHAGVGYRVGQGRAARREGKEVEAVTASSLGSTDWYTGCRKRMRAGGRQTQQQLWQMTASRPCRRGYRHIWPATVVARICCHIPCTVTSWSLHHFNHFSHQRTVGMAVQHCSDCTAGIII